MQTRLFGGFLTLPIVNWLEIITYKTRNVAAVISCKVDTGSGLRQQVPSL